jgi:hypothetical protein
MLWEFIERDKIMNMDIKQVDSLIKEVRGNVKFLGNLLGIALVFLGLAGVVGLLLGISAFLR